MKIAGPISVLLALPNPALAAALTPAQPSVAASQPQRTHSFSVSAFPYVVSFLLLFTPVR